MIRVAIFAIVLRIQVSITGFNVDCYVTGAKTQMLFRSYQYLGRNASFNECSQEPAPTIFILFIAYLFVVGANLSQPHNDHPCYGILLTGNILRHFGNNFTFIA